MVLLGVSLPESNPGKAYLRTLYNDRQISRSRLSRVNGRPFRFVIVQERFDHRTVGAATARPLASIWRLDTPDLATQFQVILSDQCTACSDT